MAEGIHALPEKPVLHGDNGATVKATTVLAMIDQLAGAESLSLPSAGERRQRLCRRSVPHREVQAAVPASGFASLEEARGWASGFVAWYNHDHPHSAIRYVSPAERHAGIDHDILARRHAMYLEARTAHPRRWARHSRNWQPIAAVTLNRERESVVNAALDAEKETALAA